MYHIMITSQSNVQPKYRYTLTHTMHLSVMLTLILFLVFRPFRMLALECRQHSFVLSSILLLNKCSTIQLTSNSLFSTLAIDRRSIFLNPKQKNSFFTLLTNVYTCTCTYTHYIVQNPVHIYPHIVYTNRSDRY